MYLKENGIRIKNIIGINLAKDPQNLTHDKLHAIQNNKKSHTKWKPDIKPKTNSLWIALFLLQFIYKNSNNFICGGSLQ